MATPVTEINPVIEAMRAVSDADPRPRIMALSNELLGESGSVLEKLLKVIAVANGYQTLPLPPDIDHAIGVMASKFTYDDEAPHCYDCAREIALVFARTIADLLRDLHGDDWRSWWYGTITTIAPAGAAAQRILARVPGGSGPLLGGRAGFPGHPSGLQQCRGDSNR